VNAGSARLARAGRLLVIWGRRVVKVQAATENTAVVSGNGRPALRGERPFDRGRLRRISPCALTGTCGLSEPSALTGMWGARYGSFLRGSVVDPIPRAGDEGGDPGSTLQGCGAPRPRPPLAPYRDVALPDGLNRPGFVGGLVRLTAGPRTSCRGLGFPGVLVPPSPFAFASRPAERRTCVRLEPLALELRRRGVADGGVPACRVPPVDPGRGGSSTSSTVRQGPRLKMSSLL
jgi:hypothetical protein